MRIFTDNKNRITKIHSKAGEARQENACGFISVSIEQVSIEWSRRLDRFEFLREENIYENEVSRKVEDHVDGYTLEYYR